MSTEFHISFSAPSAALPQWPNGCWSLYEITGEEIAERTIWTKDSGKYEIAERWPWPGFIGCFHSFDDVAAEIRKLAAIPAA